jgi:hypothetical protein
MDPALPKVVMSRSSRLGSARIAGRSIQHMGVQTPACVPIG